MRATRALLLAGVLLAAPLAGRAVVTTLDPLNKAAAATLSNGNLTVTTAPASYASVMSTTTKSTGKYCYEVFVNSIGGSHEYAWGIGRAAADLNNVPGGGSTNDSIGYIQIVPSFFFDSNTHSPEVLGTISAGDYLQVCIDMSTVNFKNVFFQSPAGVWDGKAGDDPATNTGGMYSATFYGPPGFGTLLQTSLLSGAVYAMVSVRNGAQLTVNFGATAFHYALPTGYLAWDGAATSNKLFFKTFP